MRDDNGGPGKEIDLGYVGTVNRVDRGVIEKLCYAGQVPVIPSMCLDEETRGELNVNADTAATAVAQSLVKNWSISVTSMASGWIKMTRKP